MSEPTAPQEDDTPGRRRVLSWLAAGAGALVSGAVLAGPLGVLLDPLLRRRRAAAADEDRWASVSAVERFPAGGAPVQVVLKEDERDAWLSRPDTPVGPVLVQRLEGEDFRVFSGVCPHLGCSVQFREDLSRFRCPCHRSAFRVDGERVEETGGEPNPAPRGLDPLEWRVRGGRLEVRWVRFRTGTEARVPV